MSKPKNIELPDGVRIPILYEDRSALAVDKPAGWLLASEKRFPGHRNLHLALMKSIREGDRWAKLRQIRFLRFVHRLDAETSGVLLLVKSKGALGPYSRLFSGRKVEKHYLAVVRDIPTQTEWICRDRLALHPRYRGLVQVNPRKGQSAETQFRVLESKENISLIEARPITGRTHQIRVHLLASGHPILGDRLYGAGKSEEADEHSGLALRAIQLSYQNPFDHARVVIHAPVEAFRKQYGF